MVIACEGSIAQKTRDILEKYARHGRRRVRADVTGPAHRSGSTCRTCGSRRSSATPTPRPSTRAPPVCVITVRYGVGPSTRITSRSRRPLVHFLDYGKGCYVDRSRVPRALARQRGAHAARHHRSKAPHRSAAGATDQAPGAGPRGASDVVRSWTLIDARPRLPVIAQCWEPGRHGRDRRPSGHGPSRSQVKRLALLLACSGRLAESLNHRQLPTTTSPATSIRLRRHAQRAVLLGLTTNETHAGVATVCRPLTRSSPAAPKDRRDDPAYEDLSCRRSRPRRHGDVRHACASFSAAAGAATPPSEPPPADVQARLVDGRRRRDAIVGADSLRGDALRMRLGRTIRGVSCSPTSAAATPIARIVRRRVPSPYRGGAR